MASFVLIVDRNQPRRDRFIRATSEQMVRFIGLECDRIDHFDCSIAWAKGRNTPSSQHQDDRSVALLLGDALSDSGRIDAVGVNDLWQQKGATKPDALDGYFAGIVYNSAEGGCVGTDLLGMFPVYHHESDGVILVASSPDLFLAHPLFSAKVSAQGLAGILLTNGLVENRAILDGACRLKPGHLLRWRKGGQLREERQFELLASDRFLDVPGEEVERVVDSTLKEVLGRHRPESKSALLLSGGLDSRLLAGYLTRLGEQPEALCLGLPTDLEMLAAQPVAASLGLPFHRQSAEPNDETYLQFAERTASCEALSAGFSAIDLWSAGPLLDDLAPRFWSGVMLDDLLGGYGFHLAFDRKANAWSFDRFFARLTSWGMSPDLLGKLLEPLGGDELVSDVVAAIRKSFQSGTGAPWQQAFMTKLATRCRFHLGAGLRRMSFGSWPIAPFLDRRLLALAIDLPPAMVMGRRLERRLLNGQFPELAKIPLDDGTLKFRPVKRSRLERIATLASRLAPRRLRRRIRWGRVERRRYFRHFDLNQSHWKAIRRHAEPGRQYLSNWLDSRTVDEVVPSPDAPVVLSDPFGPGASCRNLLGLMLYTNVLSSNGKLVRAA